MGIVQENIDRESTLSHAITIIYQGSVKKNDGILLDKTLSGVNLNIMKTQSIDTHPKAEAVQIELLRKASPAKRAWLMRSLSQTVLALSRRTLRALNPDLSEHALKVLFVRHCYGDELADRVQLYLKQGKDHGTA